MDAATAFQPLKPGRPVAPTPMEPEFVPLVPPAGSVLRHRFELMFQEAALEAPVNVVETSALLF